MKFILASASPRRKELLSYIINDFEVISNDIEENLNIKSAPHLVMRLSFAKAGIAAQNAHENSVIIAADTVVVCKKKKFGKPADKNEAFSMLKALSGRKHLVYTGFTVLNTAQNKSMTKYEKTKVYFTKISDNEIEDYIKTGEPMDKAGAYGIQGYAARFVRKIKGCYFNAMGFPLSLLYNILKVMDLI